MRRVAIIRGTTIEFDEFEKTVANSITDWTEVSDEDFELLKRASYGQPFTVIERPLDEREFILKTVADYVAEAKRLEQRREAQRQANELKRHAAAERRRAKKAKLPESDEGKRELIERLQKELGEQSDG